jgi:alanine racemase
LSGDRPTLAIIDLTALRHNLAVARQLARGREVIAVVKANAYGHGAVPVARTLWEAGCARLAVVTVREAAELRESGIGAELLVLGGVHDMVEARLARSLELTPVLHHAEGLALLAEAAAEGDAPMPAQVEVDTGMRRMGVAPENAVDLLCAAAEEPGVELRGAFTHFARADEPDPTASIDQLQRFREILGEAGKRGVGLPLVHTDNSAAVMAGPPLADGIPEANAVRPGLMLYGGYPGESTGQLAPVMSVRSRVVAIRDVGEREAVGYGASYHAPRATRVATLPIGYADGVLRSMGNSGEVWLAGAGRPIVGRVSMDYITVEIGDAPVSIGDEATLFGRADERADSPESWPGVPVNEAAEAAGTLAYELMIRVGERVPRRFIGVAPGRS